MRLPGVPVSKAATDGGLCADCVRGPRGMSGHPALAAHRVGAEMTFKCRGCRAMWARTTKRLAEYCWTLEE